MPIRPPGAYYYEVDSSIPIRVAVAGQVHTDVDGHTVRSVRVARRRAAVRRPWQRHRPDDRHVGSDCVRVYLLHVSHLLLHVHLLRREFIIT